MKNHLICILILLNLKAQSQVTFQKTYGTYGLEIGTAIKQTSDNGYIICGSTNEKSYLLKIDSIGNVTWSKSYFISTSSFQNKANSVEQTNDGGYILLSTGNSSIGVLQLYKTDHNGDTIWTKQFGGGNTVNKWIQGVSVQQTPDQGYIITGSAHSDYSSIPYSMTNIILIKTDSNGNIIWKKNYENSSSSYRWYTACETKQTTDGGYIIVGNIDYGGPHYSILLIRTNNLGDLVWTKFFGSTNDGFLPQNKLACIEKTTDGGFIIGSNTLDSFPYSKGYIVKVNANGSILWSKTYSGIIAINSIAETNDGGYIVKSGKRLPNNESFPVLMKIDNTGDTLWTKAYGHVNMNIDAYGSSALETADGGYILSCGITTLNDYKEICIIKTDSVGNSGCYEMEADVTISGSINTEFLEPTNTFDLALEISCPLLIVGSGGSISADCLSIDVPEIKKKNQSINIFPNPFTSNAFINFEVEQKNINIKITNLLGEVIKIINFTGLQLIIEKGEMSNGIYFMNIMDQNKNIITQKIIVQ
jgi:hypothetical protein